MQKAYSSRKLVLERDAQESKRIQAIKFRKCVTKTSEASEAAAM